jgi:hypothetical protein
MISIVIDTNVLIAAFLRGGKPLAVLRSVQEGKALLLITVEIEDEITQVIQRPKFKKYFEHREVDPQLLIADYVGLARQVVPERIDHHSVRDERDLKFLECAIAGKANYIVTGDEDLLTLVEFQGVRIVTPAQYLEIATASEGSSSAQ